jgi:proteic killer suppression protein
MEIRIDKDFYDGDPEDFGNHCRKHYGTQNAKLIARRIEHVRASKDLSVLMKLPGRWHWLTGNRQYELSVDVEHPRRLIFIPLEEVKEMFDEKGNLDTKKVLGLILKEIADTHNE